MKNNAVIIDGHSLTYRAYFATIKQLEYYQNSNVQPTNAVKLMLLMALKILNEHNPKYALVAFDAGEKTFRDDLFDNYKAGRPRSPEQLRSQLSLLQEALVYIGYRVDLQKGVEGDDLIGSLSRKLSNNKINNFIYSSDKDMLQLVNQYTSVLQPKKGVSEMIKYDINNFSELYFGLQPEQVIEYKAIVGDSSDKLPGIKGIGTKTGITLLKKYKTLDNIYQHLCELKPSQQKLFMAAKEAAYMCKKLATIKCDCYDGINLSEFLRKDVNIEAFVTFLEKYKIRNLEKEMYNSVKMFQEN